MTAGDTQAARAGTGARDVWAIIPAYNEATAIADVIEGLRDQGLAIVVVDDGSTDDTARAAASAGAAVVVHPINLGQGAALQTGLEYALARGAQFLVTFDADGQHSPDDLDALLAPLREGDAHFALGSRFLGKTVNAPPSRLALLKAAAAFTRLTTGLDLTDAHNGLRAMTRRGAACIRLRQNRMAHASEILDQIAMSGLRYVEVPVTISYSAYSLAKGQKASDSLRILLDLTARYLQR